MDNGEMIRPTPLTIQNGDVWLEKAEQELGLDPHDVDTIRKIWEDHKKRNSIGVNESRREKFINPKTGEMFQNTVDDNRFCGQYAGCKQECPVLAARHGADCTEWINQHPHQTALLMGYEVVGCSSCENRYDGEIKDCCLKCRDFSEYKPVHMSNSATSEIGSVHTDEEPKTALEIIRKQAETQESVISINRVAVSCCGLTANSDELVDALNQVENARFASGQLYALLGSFAGRKPPAREVVQAIRRKIDSNEQESIKSREKLIKLNCNTSFAKYVQIVIQREYANQVLQETLNQMWNSSTEN